MQRRLMLRIILAASAVAATLILSALVAVVNAKRDITRCDEVRVVVGDPEVIDGGPLAGVGHGFETRS